MLHWRTLRQAGSLEFIELSLDQMPVDQISTCVAQKGIAKVRAKKLNGFSLMEMMVVLLIVAIIAAASAPMVTKKLSRSAGTNDSPWVFTGLNNSIAYNMNGNNNSSAIIGSADVNRSAGQPMPKLYIESSGNEPQLGFGSRGQEGYVSLLIDRNNRRVAFSDANNIPSDSVVFGIGQTIDNWPGKVAIGRGVSALKDDSIAIGNGAGAISIGSTNSGSAKDRSPCASGYSSIAIGSEAVATNNSSIAIGSYSNATGENSPVKGKAIAIGYKAQASHANSVAIGAGAQTTSKDQIVLGDNNTTVYIPGNVVIDGDILIDGAIWYGGSLASHYYHFCDISNFKVDDQFHLTAIGISAGETLYSKNYILEAFFSDRRLKNVKEKYTAGLTELKQLDFFHFTFKDDKEKTPHVGVIAQDLQKVFPDAVTKGEDGYLRIRWEDMFYAVINAVKELDNKIAEIVQNITDINSTIEKQNKTIEEQQKTIEALQKQNEEFEKRLKKLEK